MVNRLAECRDTDSFLGKYLARVPPELQWFLDIIPADAWDDESDCEGSAGDWLCVYETLKDLYGAGVPMTLLRKLSTKQLMSLWPLTVTADEFLDSEEVEQASVDEITIILRYLAVSLLAGESSVRVRRSQSG